MSRRLVVMRHAKAEQGGRTDFERELTDRGRADAAEVGAWLAGQGFAPDHALVSAAARTRATWESLAEGGGWTLEAEYDRGLYSAEPSTAVDLNGLVDDAARSLVVAVDSDRLFLPEQSERIARGIPGAGPVRYVHSPYGHDGFLIEESQVGALVADFLAEGVPSV